MTPSQELVGPELTRSETNKIEQHATAAYGRGQQAMILFAADVAKLQEGMAHRMRGYTNFGEYIEQKFEGITSGNAMNYARMGKVLLVLERAERIKLEGHKDQLPSTTGVRDLATILGKFGEETMLKVYDEAAQSGRKVIPQSIQAAMSHLVGPPKPAELAPKSLEPEEAEDSEPEEEEEEENALLDQLGQLQERIEDMRDAATDHKTSDFNYHLASLIEEAKQIQEQVK